MIQYPFERNGVVNPFLEVKNPSGKQISTLNYIAGTLAFKKVDMPTGVARASATLAIVQTRPGEPSRGPGCR